MGSSLDEWVVHITGSLDGPHALFNSVLIVKVKLVHLRSVIENPQLQPSVTVAPCDGQSLVEGLLGARIICRLAAQSETVPRKEAARFVRIFGHHFQCVRNERYQSSLQTRGPPVVIFGDCYGLAYVMGIRIVVECETHRVQGLYHLH